MNYYEKYIKYKYKYLDLKFDNNLLELTDQKGGNNEKYSCDPKKKFVDICDKHKKGIYKSKEKCVNDCKTKYINYHLIKARIKHETLQYTSFIKDIFNENMTVYIKGGTVLGLKILKMIYDKYPGNNFEIYFNEFLKLELIRDWDFAGYTNNKSIDESYRNYLDKIAKKYNLVPRAKTFILYQARTPIKIDDQALFEIAILENDDYCGLELPMTTMKVKVKPYNLPHIFMLAKSFYAYRTKNIPFDLDVIKYILNDINIIIPEHKDGLFNFDKLYTDNLSQQLLQLINKTTKNKNIQQFLITHIQEPHRLFYRFYEKNIPKVNKITRFLIENNITNKRPTWLFDSKEINIIIDNFLENLERELYKNNNINELLDGINLNRIQIEYNNIGCKGKSMIKILFERIYQDLINSNKQNKLIDLLKFLNKNNLFTN